MFDKLRGLDVDVHLVRMLRSLSFQKLKTSLAPDVG